MLLSDLSIRRPVLAMVASLVLVLLGLMCLERLPVREYPDIDAPIVSIMTVYKGASAEVMESQVTRPLEDSLSGIEGIRTMKSLSREEVSRISVEFALSRDPDSAAADVRDRVSRVRARLPEEIDEPVISKVEADAQPIVWLAFISDRHDALQISDVAHRYVRDRLQTLPGVSSVIIGGERRYAMRIWLDRDRMAAYGVTVGDVEAALSKRNLELPGGRIESLNRELTVLSETDLRSPEQFNALIIREVNGYPIRLSEFGRAEIGAEDERNIVRVNGNPAVGIGVVKQATANTLEVARAIKDELPKLNESLPAGMRLSISFDTSLFIEESIRAVYETLLEALGLVLAITFLFLRSARALLIPFVTIPVSLIGSFIFLYLFGFSVNILTLLALVLAIGLVVDDAIVMMENIHRRIEQGMAPREAAFEGSREIAFAVIAMTLTLAAVFTPLAFMSGNTGRLFSEFALAVSCAVLVSGFVALTLTPMMCSRLLHGTGTLSGGVSTGTSGERLPVVFGAVLARVLRWRRWVMVLMVLMAIAAYRLFIGLNSELSPIEDRGNVMTVVSAPEGSSLDYTDRYAAEIEKFLAEIPEVGSYFMVVAPGLDRPNPVNSALAFLRLLPWEQRSRSQQEIAAELLPKLQQLPGVLAFPINPPSLGQNFRKAPIQFVIQGPNYDELDRMVARFMEQASAVPGIVNVDSDLRLDKPQLTVAVNREKAADVGVDVDDIGRTLQTLLGGRQITRFKRDGEQYDVIVRLADSERSTPRDVMSLYLRSERGGLVQLANVVDLQERASARELNHFNRLRAATVAANLAPGYALGQALVEMQRIAEDLLPAAFKTDLDGQSREFQESSRTLLLTFLFALVFIYLVLSAQFESFLDPLIIMLSVPLAVLGALLALHLSGGTLNVYSQIGLVMLVGLITKNGILIVEFANQLQCSGFGPGEAALRASVLRLRPIVMTSLTMILGALPLALATGAGAESRQQIGWVIVGGMTVGTFLTIFVIPSVYVSFSSMRRHGPTGGRRDLHVNF